MKSAARECCLRENIRRLIWIALVLCLLVYGRYASARQTDSGTGEERIHWTSVESAQVKLDDKTPLTWNVYQPAAKKDKKDKKNSNLVLLLLGHRYLMLDTKARLVYVVPLSEIHAQGADFESGDLADETRLLPTTDWSLRDVGPAELIDVKLGDYGRVLEVSLPHPPDLRPFY